MGPAPKESVAFWPSPEAVEHWAGKLQGMQAGALRSAATGKAYERHGDLISFSPKVFLPLTQLCRDACGYCTFAHGPRPGRRAFMTAEEVLNIARAGAAAGCTEALFTLGELPEQRYRIVREDLATLGHDSTLSYLAEIAALVRDETGLLPHINAGVMDETDIAALREVSVSQGLMLEGTAPGLMARGGPHFRSKGKDPHRRIETIAAAGRQNVPFTTGLLIGLGESRAERIHALLVIQALHREYGHIGEVIVQNFLPKPGTRMADHPPAPPDELDWTIAAARLILDGEVTIQAPPNLQGDDFARLIDAGINDWGGVSPVTPDHVNPEAAWPALDHLRAGTEARGRRLVARLPVYPAVVARLDRWIAPSMRAPLLRHADAAGWARGDTWSPGQTEAPPRLPGSVPGILRLRAIDAILGKAMRREGLVHAEISTLFSARGPDVAAVIAAADEARRATNGDAVRYVVNRNINYTNICAFACSFCAFSKGKTAEKLRGKPYDIEPEEVSRRTAEAWARGATEVCMQGGIHPRYTGETYLELLAAAKAGAPDIHVHAFSPLEIWHGATSLGIGTEAFLTRLAEAGLGSLPGTAAEILDDDARAILCPDKLDTATWLRIVGEAHRAGIPTTATIMFGHIDTPAQWATHLTLLRQQQDATGGFTEFVPLPFVHMEAPLYLRGKARRGPTYRETILMHAVARLALAGSIDNIQASWVKLGSAGVADALGAGVNDLGGTLMNESISRAAGTGHGQEWAPEVMDRTIRAAGRQPGQRTTLYRSAPPGQIARSYGATALTDLNLGLRRRPRLAVKTG